ncbi:protein sidekick-1 isoform X7 [Spodoptera frugiperda]|uniref:Protein sidekick-1 isoform X6 n=1 Tax=Spodoptera frugiperda TaxID=7108 RepID=A0A9R0ENA4_SPOFR|nr:protein sidekick-1 isoform X6 [Spodoptera frugiperda]XP_050561633.1 protein sidekick-1 isoform X7 [Spodoptera frugiperda]
MSARVTMTTKMLLSLLLHCFCVATTASIPSGGGLPGVSGGDGTRPERPYFDDVSPRNVSAVVGQAAVLRCRAKHIGNRTVSWMRKRDLHILTSHIFTYTGDARFSVLHPEPSDDWDLKIDYVQPRDAGVYECQINTEPKINMAVILTVEGSVSFVAAAAATIWGSQDVYVKKGSTISLTCSVNVHSSPPSTASILWYHGNSVVDFDSPRGGISLETEKTEGGTTSKLLVTKAALTDSGNYTCVPNNAHPASVSVHVLNGEHPAAMQTSNRASSYLTSQLSCAIVTYLLSSAVCR